MILRANLGDPAVYGGRPRFWYFLYQLICHFILPFALLRLLLRARHDRDYLNHLRERLGFGYGGRYIHQNAIWVHAVSVGETRAAQSLIEAYLARGDSILLTHMTLNGRRAGSSLYGDAIAANRLRQVYLPYDLCWSVECFLRTFKPKLGLVMETEAWPTIVFRCREIGPPLFLVNARLSEKSANRVRRFGRIGRTLFQAFSGILAQTRLDAERYRSLGVKDVEEVGNLKFDICLDAGLVERGRKWHQALKVGDFLMVCAASTRDGEEAIILDAWKELLASQAIQPSPILCIVPRHPERFSVAEKAIQNAGFVSRRRSAWSEPPSNMGALEVLLGDSMGEMPMYYSASDLVIMGGSLLPFGGQNLIEACAAGCPVLVGEFTYNFQQATLDALAAGAAMRVDAQQQGDGIVSLATALNNLLSDKNQIDLMAKAASAYSIHHQGATKRIMTLLDKKIDANWLDLNGS